MMSGERLSCGDILCNEDTGDVYLFKRFDTMGRVVAWDCTSNTAEVIDPIPARMWRYGRESLVSDLLSEDS